jgi:type II secretory pathway component PulC
VRPGDVVLSVNGRSIERPDAAHEVFQSLRSAPALVVRLVRDGKERTLTFEIADR